MSGSAISVIVTLFLLLLASALSFWGSSRRGRWPLIVAILLLVIAQASFSVAFVSSSAFDVLSRSDGYWIIAVNVSLLFFLVLATTRKRTDALTTEREWLLAEIEAQGITLSMTDEQFAHMRKLAEAAGPAAMERFRALAKRVGREP